jgi:uncharacterized damage-inducible protein DinB
VGSLGKCGHRLRPRRQVLFKSRFVGNDGLPAWQIVVHVVNHATPHRGQIVGMLRKLDMKAPPPGTPLIVRWGKLRPFLDATDNVY